MCDETAKHTKTFAKTTSRESVSTFLRDNSVLAALSQFSESLLPDVGGIFERPTSAFALLL